MNIVRPYAALPGPWDRTSPVGELSAGKSLFPEGAVARIFRPSRSVMTSGRAGTNGWRLTFDRRFRCYIEPLMGWTSSDDPLDHIELRFPTLDAAVRYARRQGLAFVIEDAMRHSAASPRLECLASTTFKSLQR